MKRSSTADKHTSVAEQAAESAIVAAYADLGEDRAAQHKAPMHAESVQTLLENAVHNLSPESEAAARFGARAKGWPDGLVEEYQRYITLLHEKKAVLQLVSLLRGTVLDNPEKQVLETERAWICNECLDASIHMRDTYTNVPEETRSELNYLVNLDKFDIGT